MFFLVCYLLKVPYLLTIFQIQLICAYKKNKQIKCFNWKKIQVSLDAHCLITNYAKISCLTCPALKQIHRQIFTNNVTATPSYVQLIKSELLVVCTAPTKQDFTFFKHCNSWWPYENHFTNKPINTVCILRILNFHYSIHCLEII